MILHLSDLHFGTEQPVLCAALRRLSERLQPEAVVVSGDLTQRARVAQFVQARQFLVSLQWPLLVVPGNHDIPLFEFAERLLQPFDRFRQQFGGLEPTLTTAHFHLVGVNSVGVTSGASVPDDLVQGVLDYLQSQGFPAATEERLIEESLTFALPPELRKDLRARS